MDREVLAQAIRHCNARALPGTILVNNGRRHSFLEIRCYEVDAVVDSVMKEFSVKVEVFTKMDRPHVVIRIMQHSGFSSTFDLQLNV